MIVGAYGYGSYTGRAYVYDGSARGLSSSASTTLTGEAEDPRFGASVSGAGDVNGDGHDDVIGGAYPYGGGAYAYLYHGNADADADGLVAVEDCDDADATVGAAGSRYIDADGDSYGSSAIATVCPDVARYANVAGDCDDGSSSINPGAAETVADGVDQDCDGCACHASPAPAAWSFALVALTLCWRRRLAA